MFKFDQIKSMFNCVLCSKILVDPVGIPCGITVCQSHLKCYATQKAFQCQCCNKLHSVPNEGFFINKFIQNQLRIELNAMDINPIYEECKDEIEKANKSVEQIEETTNDSENYIYNYFEVIKRQVDIRREVLKEKIDNYSNELIQSINETRASYIKLSKETSELKTKIENSKKELNELINQFDTLKIDEKNFHSIKNKVVALSYILKDDCIKLNSSFIGHKEYSFGYVDQQIEDIVGTLSIFSGLVNTLFKNYFNKFVYILSF